MVISTWRRRLQGHSASSRRLELWPRRASTSCLSSSIRGQESSEESSEQWPTAQEVRFRSLLGDPDPTTQETVWEVTSAALQQTQQQPQNVYRPQSEQRQQQQQQQQQQLQQQQQQQKQQQQQQHQH